MKNVLYLVFGLIVTLTFSACGCAKNTDVKESAAPTVAADASAPTENIETPESNIDKKHEESTQTSDSKTPAISENKDVVSESTAPKVFVLFDLSDLSYHLEGCANLTGKEYREMPWETVQTIGLWQCPVCNPPRYEGYQNAQ